MKIVKKTVRTTAHTQMLDITNTVAEAVRDSGVTDGIAVVWIPHTTDPNVCLDISREINKIVPWEDDYRHLEGNSAAHLKSSLFGVSQTILVEDGALVLGTWQDVYFTEFDGPRTRQVWIKVIEG